MANRAVQKARGCRVSEQMKTLCCAVDRVDQIQRISDAKWAGRRHRVNVGECQYCRNALAFAYLVIDAEGETHECKPGSAAARKAEGYLKDGAPAGVFVFPLSSCEIMCEGDVYEAGIKHYEARAESWRTGQTAAKESKAPEQSELSGESVEF